MRACLLALAAWIVAGCNSEPSLSVDLAPSPPPRESTRAGDASHQRPAGTGVPEGDGGAGSGGSAQGGGAGTDPSHHDGSGGSGAGQSSLVWVLDNADPD
jgi:hypothetical protein